MSSIWSKLTNLVSQVTGVLPIANGGTNKALTLAAGALVWTDADSFEVTAAGTASDWALSGGTGTPTFSSTTTTAKIVDGSADAIQLTVQGNATQTSNILVVEKSDGTDLLAVSNTAGTAIKGTTSNTGAASGMVGQTIIKRGSTNTVSAQYVDIASIASGDGFGAGVWLVTAQVVYYWAGVTMTAFDLEFGVTKNSGNDGNNVTVGDNLVYALGDTTLAIGANAFDAYSMSIGPILVTCDGTNTVIGGQGSAAFTTLYLKGYCGSFSAGQPTARYTFMAQRIF